MDTQFSTNFKKNVEDKKEHRETEKIISKWFPEKAVEREISERKLTTEEEEEKARLKKELEKFSPLGEKEESNASDEAEALKEKEIKDKIRHLLLLAQDKGILYALKIAEKTNDPLLIDLFHDILIKEGIYKNLK
jgi:hypothetical protein